MLKNIACLIVVINSCFTGLAQIDSSSLYTRIITGGNTKDWYRRPGIFDNAGHITFSTLTFKIKPKAGSLSNLGRGRDMLSSFRNFNNWKVEKQDSSYLLIISSKEKYFIQLLNNPEKILVLNTSPDNRKGTKSIAGQYFEKSLHIY